MENEVLEFMSKMYVKGKSPHPIIRALIKVCFGIYALIFLLLIFIGEFSFGIITSNAMPLLLLFYVMNVTKPVDGYRSTVVKVALSDEDIIIEYNVLNKQEKINILYKNITNLQYSKQLQCLNIQGFTIETTQDLKQLNKKENVKNYVDKKEEKQTFLFVSGQEKEKIVHILEQKTEKKTSIIN